MNIASTNPNMESTPVLPILRVTGFSPRSVELAWLYAHKGAPKATSSSPSIMYQVSRSEHGSQAYEVVYEGSDRMCSVTELKPQTRYIFKLRIGSKLEDESLPVSWSKEYVELETSTSDESSIGNANNRLARAVAEGDHAGVTQIFHEHGKYLSVEARDKYGKTLLMAACQVGSPEIVVCLLQHGADILATTKSGKTALSATISSGSLRVAEALLRHDPELINLRDAGGSTPLMWASENASMTKNGPNIVELFIRNGASVSAVDSNGFTALDRLCMTSGNVRAAQILLKSGAELRMEPNTKNPMTTLMVAAMNGHKELVRELLDKHNMDPRIRNLRGFDAQIYAESNGHIVVGKMLEEKKLELMASKTQ